MMPAPFDDATVSLSPPPDTQQPNESPSWTAGLCVFDAAAAAQWST